MERALKLKEPYEGLEIFRGEKVIFARLLKPHLVISTCRQNGGLRQDLAFVANHQACEPRPCPGKEHRDCLAVKNPALYHRLVCEYHGLPPEKTALLGTAANMTLAGFSKKEFPLPGQEILLIFGIATAGVETNAGRAGDPASVLEWEGRFHPLEEGPFSGTINIMLFVNQELAPAALVRAVKMATEAKTALLQELNIASRYSSGLATGTGTDQIAIASLKTNHTPLRGAGKHVKLGELLARVVKESVREALARQNKITPETVRYVPRLLERFGLGEEKLFTRLRPYLEEPLFTWLFQNRRAVLSDTALVASVLAYIHLLDQHFWEILPADHLLESLLLQAALISSSLSGKVSAIPSYREKLSRLQDPLELLLAALALGFREKWSVPYYQFEPPKP